MKKVIAILMALVMVLGMCACTRTKVNEETKESVANPIVAYDNLSAVNSKIGCELSGPGAMGVTDISYNVINETIAEYVFSFNGTEITYRAGKTEEDISGIYGENGSIFAAGNCGKTESYVDGNLKVYRWFNDDVQYVLAVDLTGNTDFDARALAMELAGEMSEEIASYNKYDGVYYDEYNQRPYAEIKSLGKCLEIKVWWGSSANENTQWTMTAKFDGENKLSYADCVCADYVYNEQTQDFDETPVEVNASGYFEIKDEKLLWTGGPEGCTDCVFVYDAALVFVD